MTTQPNIVVQTLSRLTMLLKPLIEDKSCEIIKSEEQIVFFLESGSATIFISVKDHPNLEDEALVTVSGVLAKLVSTALPQEIAVGALVLNSKFNGFAIALDGDLLLLRGTLIGSVMDELEFVSLFRSLAVTADDLDDKFMTALSQVTPSKAKSEEGAVLHGLKEMSQKLQDVIASETERLVEMFGDSLNEADKAEFVQLLSEQSFQQAVRNIALGGPAAALTTLILSNSINDDSRQAMGAKILEDVPKHHLIRKMLAFTVFVTASIVCDAMDADKSHIQGRLSLIFS